MSRGPIVAAIVLALTCIGAGTARAALPDDTGAAAPGLDCVDRVPIPRIPNVIEEQWSPDSSRLALTWFARLPSTRTITHYQEDELIDVLDLATGSLRPLGVGEHPRWSATGTYASYWGPNADELRVVRSERVVARLTPTIPEVRWVGESLLFIDKDQIRRWDEGGTHTVAQLATDLVPRYPHDDVYFSADGARFTMTRYSSDGTIDRYLGQVATASAAPLDLPGAMYVEWAPRGAVLLIRYPDRLELHDLDAGTSRSAAVADLGGVVHEWAPDGRTLLLGSVSPTVPAADAFDRFTAWEASGEHITATLPNVLGARAFSPDSRWFAGVSRTGVADTRLELFRCSEGDRAIPERAFPDAAARLALISSAAVRFVRPAAGDISQFLQGSHTGIDVAAPFGSLVVAADGGRITHVGWVPAGGERVCVQHSLTLESCYYHTSLPLVRVGDAVARGQPIALIGMTGDVTGPHVHWEAKDLGRIVDPLAR